MALGIHPWSEFNIYYHFPSPLPLYQVVSLHCCILSRSLLMACSFSFWLWLRRRWEGILEDLWHHKNKGIYRLLSKVAFCCSKVRFCDRDKDIPKFTQFSSQYYSFDVLKRCGGQWLLALCGNVVVVSSCCEGRVVHLFLFSPQLGIGGGLLSK